MRLEKYITESVNDRGIFKAVFMAGTPGSGKTYVAKKLSKGVEPRFVNTDTWTEWFKDDWKHYDERIKTLTQSQLTLYLNSMLPLWIDGTSSKPSSVLRRKGILEGLGYDTAMLWVDTDIQTAKDRAKAREAEIGRHVDESFIDKVYNDIQKMKPFYKSHFRTFQVVHNNDGELTDDYLRKIYGVTTSFFDGNIINPIGESNVRVLKQVGDKYLTDLPEYDMQEIKNLTKAWFTK